MPKNKPLHLAILGGTFCPVHNGHIQIALSLQKRFQFDRFMFIPNQAPVLDKKTEIPTKHRLAMLELALAPYPELTIDRREINRQTPSFMVDTLKSIRSELPHPSIALSLIIGEDNLQQLHRWHEWRTLLTLCNLIVVERPGIPAQELSDPLKKRLLSGEIKELSNDSELLSGIRGGIFRCHAGAYPFSSTDIRELIRKDQDASAFLPHVVLSYIKQHHLFKSIRS